MRITDEAVEAFRAEAKDCTGRELSAELVHRCLSRALPHLSQGAVRVELEGSGAERVSKILGTGVDGQVVVAAMEDGDYGDSPCWLWRNHETNVTGFGRWAKEAGQAPYIRADIAIKGILSALSRAPVGVTDEMVQKFITTSRDEDAGYRDWTEAVTAGLNATLASHDPAPTDTQEGLSGAGELYERLKMALGHLTNIEAHGNAEANDKLQVANKALRKISSGTYDGIEVTRSHSARDLRNIARAALGGAEQWVS